MAATKADLVRWVKEAAKKKNVTHVVIVCDTFDYEDYPVEVLKGQDVREVAKANNGPNMTRLMEVYSLTGKHTLDEQFAQAGRVFNYD
jgi:hypothetical protein